MRRLIALLGLCALACGAATVQAQTLKLAYKPGATRVYATHIVMDETVDLGSVSEPVKLDMKATETETVQSVDSQGVADVQLTFSDVTGTVSAAGVTNTKLPTPPTSDMKIAPDGRTLSINGLNLGGSPFTSVGGPGGAQSAVLPDSPVKPGDTWTKSYDRANPLGTGSLHVSAKSKYLRDEKVNGVQTAVVSTKTTTPVDMSIDLSKFGQLSGSQMTALTSLGITGMTITGTTAGDATTWIDPKAEQIEKTSAKISIDGAFSFVVAPGAKYPGPTGPFTIKGTETVDVAAK